MRATTAAAAAALWSGRAAWRYALDGGFDARSLRLLLTHALWPALLTAAFLALCWLAGRGARRLARLPPEAGFVDELLAFALGLAAAGLLVFALGAAGAYGPGGFAAALLALAGAAAFGARGLPRPAAVPAAGTLAGAALAYAAWRAAVVALAPPTEWDALAYHLALPKLYLARGAVVSLPWLLHSHWPHSLELLYGLALAAGRDGAAALGHAGVVAAWAALAGAAAARWGKADGWTTAAVLACQTVPLSLAGVAHSDGGFAFFHLASAAALWRWKESRAQAWLAAAGVFAGAALSCKLLGALTCAAWALAAWRLGGAPALARFCAFAALPAAPWLLKTWLTDGDPVWPFLPGVFGGAWGGPALAGDYAALNRWSSWPAAEELLRYKPLPLALPAAAAAAAAFARRRPWPDWLKLLWLPAPLFLAALWNHHEGWRFLLPVYPALAATIAWQAREISALGAHGRAAALAVVLAALSPLLTAGPSNELFAVLGLRSRAAPAADPRALYLERALDHYAPYRVFDAALAGRPARVLLFREIRGYHLGADYVWGDPHNQRLLDYAAVSAPADLARRLDELGVTHVLVNENLGMYRPEGGYYDARTLRLMDGVLAAARPVAAQGGLRLYERRGANL